MTAQMKSFAAAFALAGLFLTAPAEAQIKERSFKFAYVNDKDHPHGLGVHKFAELLSEKSGGKMKVRTYPSGQLGADAQVIASLQGGTIDMTTVSSGLLAGQIKEFAILDLPFLFNSYKEIDAVL